MGFGRFKANAGPMAALFAVLFMLAMSATGCATATKKTLRVDLTQLAPYVHAAKPPDCTMPVMESMPIGDYKQVAIVEAWGSLADETPDLLPALTRRACEAGADALVIINSQHQDIKHLLYAATPNDTFNEASKKNSFADPGDYIRAMEHTRQIGEAEHSGFYIDAVAINRSPTEVKHTSNDSIPGSQQPSS
jgi:hypothetical protein